MIPKDTQVVPKLTARLVYLVIEARLFDNIPPPILIVGRIPAPFS